MGRTATVVEVASTTTPGTTYRVWVTSEGPEFCDCPAHKYAKGGVRKPCKHMKALWDSTDGDVARTLADRVQQAPMLHVTDRRFRFIEVQEENDAGEWVAVADLSRFNHLEVD